MDLPRVLVQHLGAASTARSLGKPFHAVWLYHRFTLSFRDVEDLLAERRLS